jgi:hypothetical protein
MESKNLKRLERKLRRQEAKVINAKFNFGKSADGNIVTSTHHPSAHVYNKLMRDINRERDANFKGMLLAFEQGEVAVKKVIKTSKGFKKNLYKQSIKNVNDTRSFIEKLCIHLSADTENPIYLCQARS